MSERESPPPLDRLLTAASHDDAGIRAKVAWTLRLYSDTSAWSTLLILLKDNSGTVRQAALAAIGAMGDSLLCLPVIAMLADPVAHVRQAAASALGQIGDASAVHTLMRLVESEHELEVIATAVWALGMIGDERAAPDLIRLLSHSDKKIRLNAIWALGKLCKISSAKNLLPKLLDTDPDIRAAAAEAVGCLRVADTVNELASLLRDQARAYVGTADEAPVAAFAAAALKKIGTREARQALEYLRQA